MDECEYMESVRLEIISKNYLLDNQSIILSISGGQDSNFLYLIFATFQYQYKLSLFLVYCNHLWQANSAEVQFDLIKLFYWLKQPLALFLPFSLLKQTEWDASFWRYTSFQRICFFCEANFLVTGRTSTDIVESFLFYLSRGSRLSLVSEFNNNNLPKYSKLDFFTTKKIPFKTLLVSKKPFGAIKRNQSITILQPLENLNRYEIFQLIHFYNFPVYTDQTNKLLKYSRNRIRQELLPFLRYYFNPKTDLSIQRFIYGLSDDLNFLDELTLKLKNLNIGLTKPNCFSYNFSFFCNCPYIFQKRLLIEGFNDIGIFDLNFLQLEFILKLLSIEFETLNFQTKKFTLIIDQNLKIIIYSSSFYIYKI